MQDSSDDALSELVRKAKSGNLQAFRGLYDLYSKRVLNFAFKMLNNREEAEDVTQEAFTSVFKKLQSLQDDSRFEAWLFRITRNFVYQRYRQRTGEHVSLESDNELKQEISSLRAPVKSPEEAILANELRDVVERLIAELPEQFRAVFVLSALQGFSYQAISEIVGKSVPAVKTDIHRARLEVRQKIKQFLGTLLENEL